MGKPGGGADWPAIKHADPPNIAAHGGREALTAGQPDIEPEGPMPDAECEDRLHPPSATGRAGAAPLANLAHHANASAPGKAPPRDQSETREATSDKPQQAAGRERSTSGHNRNDDPFDAFMECCMGDPHTVPTPAAPRVHPEPRRDHAEDKPLTIPRQAHLHRNYTALGCTRQVTAASEGHAAASGQAVRTTDQRGPPGGGARVEEATNTASEPTGPPPGTAPPWGRGHLHYARLEGDASRPSDQAEQAAAGDLGLWISRLTAGEQHALAVRIRWLLTSRFRNLAEGIRTMADITFDHQTGHTPPATMVHSGYWHYVATRLMPHMRAYNPDAMNGLHWQWHQLPGTPTGATTRDGFPLWHIQKSPATLRPAEGPGQSSHLGDAREYARATPGDKDPSPILSLQPHAASRGTASRLP